MRTRRLCCTLVPLLALAACSSADFAVASAGLDGSDARLDDAATIEDASAPPDATDDGARPPADVADVGVTPDGSEPRDVSVTPDAPAGPALLSRGMPSKQSTTYSDGLGTYAASRGNDGDLANYQATTSEAKPWWRVDLGARHAIVRVDIYNRKGRACPGSTECERVSKLDVEVSDDDVTYTAKGELLGVALYPSSVAFDATARYVRVRSRQTNFLDMGEVEVWGD